MLNAILKGKDIRLSCDTLTSFRGLYRDIEDFFTAAVFSRILYLPNETIRSVFAQLIGQDIGGNYVTHEFWPRWDASSLKGRSYIEPDMLIRFDDIDIIIEAKRNDMTPHSIEQIENEKSAYTFEYAQDGKPFVLLAIGGGVAQKRAIANTRFRKWQDLFEIIEKIQTSNSSNGVILLDLLQAFSLHGYFPTRWLSSLDTKNFHLDDSLIPILNWREKS